MILKVFSNVNDSMLLWFFLSITPLSSKRTFKKGTYENNITRWEAAEHKSFLYSVFILL